MGLSVAPAVAEAAIDAGYAVPMTDPAGVLALENERRKRENDHARGIVIEVNSQGDLSQYEYLGNPLGFKLKSKGEPELGNAFAKMSGKEIDVARRIACY